jgi:hypothetical protein
VFEQLQSEHRVRNRIEVSALDATLLLAHPMVSAH